MSREITDLIVGFCQFVRSSGLKVGIQETLDALVAARVGTITDKNTFKFALRSLLCSSKDDFERFNSLFDAYWEHQPRYGTLPQAEPGSSHPDGVEPDTQSQVMTGDRNGSTDDSEAKSVSGASVRERLKKTDFSKLSPSEIDQLDQLALRLWQQMSLRLARRLKSTKIKAQLNLRRTIRQSVSHGGEPITLRFKGKRRRKPRLVVLLDVSGSMEQYSFFFLRFIYALQQHFERVESFIFSTQLKRITEFLKTGRLPETLKVLSEQATAWGSGTKIGHCVGEFNTSYAQRILSRDSLVIILSDGWDTGEPEVLDTELRTIKRRAKKLIWLNPLLGMENYQPLTRGMSTALPLLDVFAAAHNLESLLELEKHLKVI